MNRKQRRADKGSGNKTNPALQGLFATALQHHQAGRLAEAEPLYRQILARDPRHADTLHLLGVLAHQAGQPAIAADLIGQAIAVNGSIHFYHSNRANALKDLGRLDEAAAGYRRALALKPDFADALTNLGVVLKTQAKYDDAASLYRRALKLKPDSADAHNNLGNVLESLDQMDEAAACFERAVALNPSFAVALYNLGNVRKSQGKLDEAIGLYERVLEIKPDYIDALNNLSTAFVAQNKYVRAEQCHRTILSLRPGDVEAINNLGCALQHQGRLDEAAACFEKAFTLKPDDADTFNNMANVLKEQGRLDEAIVFYKKAVSAKPDSNLFYSNLLLTMVYAAGMPPAALAETARQFGTQLADPLRRHRAFANDPDPGRKLRIGYVSPDFRDHAVNYFFEPLLKLHDCAQFEALAYSHGAQQDEVTARLKNEFDHWRDIRKLSDDAAADLIESDKIDILVDLAGHTANNRLLVFARKPAPAQVTWLGFPATTGMAAMDYRITDNYAEPAGLTEHLNVETLWRLPEIFCCYQPHENSPAVIDHPPFADNGHITFGCFNNFAKVTDPVLQAWARILAQVPDAKLLLEIGGLESPKFRAEVEERLKRFGLPPECVMLEPRKRSNQFALYNRIDIALDPFPCVGGTTSMDTMWMGVPFVTLAGDHFVSRMGVTILTNAGMPELISRNVDEYVGLAVGLAQDKDRLRGLRHDLRRKVAGSPLMNQEAFARNMEVAYRGMWQKWCAVSSEGVPNDR